MSGFGRIPGKRALVAAAGLVGLTTGALGLIGVAAAPAGATPITFKDVTCTAHIQELNQNVSTTQTFTVEATSPPEANAGSDVTITIPGGDTPLPSSATSNGTTFTINEYTNLSNGYEVHGATVVPGSIHASGPTKNNGTVVTATASFVGNTLVTATPGPLTPGTLSTPSVTFKVHAGAAGSKITVTPATITLTTKLNGVLHAAVTCDLSALANNTLTTTQVVAPPPPGAPNAVADTAQTKEGTPVTIDVLKNDTPDASKTKLPIDEGSLAITSNPSHGTAMVNSADHTVTYTPAAGFSGTDSFTYKLCSQLPVATTTTSTTVQPDAAIQAVSKAAAAVAPCDHAVVTVTVVKATTVTTQAATTVAPTTAAPSQLPRTGSSSGPLALLGFGLLVSGLAATGYARSRRRTA